MEERLGEVHIHALAGGSFRLDEGSRRDWERDEGWGGRVRTMHDWTCDEVKSFLEERWVLNS